MHIDRRTPYKLAGPLEHCIQGVERGAISCQFHLLVLGPCITIDR